MGLEIYVEAGCLNCGRAVELAKDAAREYPDLVVEVIDISDTGRQVPEDIFAVPTYVLNGKVISLGNPSPGELAGKIDAALADRP